MKERHLEGLEIVGEIDITANPREVGHERGDLDVLRWLLAALNARLEQDHRPET